MCVWLIDAVRSLACVVQIQLTFEEIRGLKKRTTAVLFDNAIEIYTFDTSYVFRSFLKRDYVRVSALIALHAVRIAIPFESAAECNVVCLYSGFCVAAYLDVAFLAAAVGLAVLSGCSQAYDILSLLLQYNNEFPSRPVSW